MVKTEFEPTQAFAIGVTVIIEVTAALVVLFATNDAIFPIPLAASPVDVFEFVQLNVEFTGMPVKLITDVFAPLHTTMFDTDVTVGIGLTSKVALFDIALGKHVPETTTL